MKIKFCMYSGAKNFEDLGCRQQQHNKVKISNDLRIYCKELPASGLNLVSVQLESTRSTVQLESTRSNEIITLPVNSSEQSTSVSTSLAMDDTVPSILQLMLKHGLLYNFYHELSCMVRTLP